MDRPSGLGEGRPTCGCFLGHRLGSRPVSGRLSAGADRAGLAPQQGWHGALPGFCDFVLSQLGFGRRTVGDPTSHQHCDARPRARAYWAKLSKSPRIEASPERRSWAQRSQILA